MKLDLRPGEYVVWKNGKNVVTNMRALLLSWRGVKGEVALDAPGLIVRPYIIYYEYRYEYEPDYRYLHSDVSLSEYNRRSTRRVPDHRPSGYSNVYFVMNGVSQLSFKLPDQTAQELVTMLASMGIKVVEDLS